MEISADENPGAASADALPAGPDVRQAAGHGSAEPSGQPTAMPDAGTGASRGQSDPMTQAQ